MKRMLMVFACALILYSGANAAPIENVTSSALMPGDSAIFNLDFIDPFGLPFYNAMIKARPAGATADSSTTLTHVPTDPFYLTTLEGTMHFTNPAGPIPFYARIEADTLVATQSYENTSNQFPPAASLYAPLASDPVGDTVSGTLGPYLDLTGAAMTYSSTRLYGQLSNVSGGWPDNQNFSTFFVYGILLINPDTLSLTVTAMVNVNVPFLFTPGLYTLNLADTSFQRVADISHQPSGNNLNLACNISDLLSTPGFPVWPPDSGYIIVAGFTASVTLAGTPAFNDYSYPSLFIPQTQFLNVTGNHAPAISNISFDVIPNLTVNVSCDYFDADNNLPVIRQLLFDRGVFDMGSLDHSYSDSASFSHALTWPGNGWHVYFFRFSDGASTVETPMDSIYVNPNAVDEDPLPGEFTLGQNYPNPFNSRTNIVFNLPATSDIELSVYDITGSKVAVLASGRVDAGTHSVTWDGYNKAGHPVSSGIYFYSVSINGNHRVSKSMLLLK